MKQEIMEITGSLFLGVLYLLASLILDVLYNLFECVGQPSANLRHFGQVVEGVWVPLSGHEFDPEVCRHVDEFVLCFLKDRRLGGNHFPNNYLRDISHLDAG
jgi:hypothetical protein